MQWASYAAQSKARKKCRVPTHHQVNTGVWESQTHLLSSAHFVCPAFSPWWYLVPVHKELPSTLWSRCQSFFFVCFNLVSDVCICFWTSVVRTKGVEETLVLQLYFLVDFLSSPKSPDLPMHEHCNNFQHCFFSWFCFLLFAFLCLYNSHAQLDNLYLLWHLISCWFSHLQGNKSWCTRAYWKSQIWGVSHHLFLHLKVVL